MANHPFDREVINNLERPLSSDINMGQTYWAQALIETIFRSIATRTSLSSDAASVQPPAGAAAFVGAAFKARGVTAALQVTLDPGLGVFNDNTTSASVGNVSGVNDNELLKPLVLTARETINVPAADPTNPRIDLIEVQIGRQLTDATSRDVFNPSAAAFQPGTVNKTLTYYLGGRSTVNGAGPINYKTGTPAAGPSAPATDAGYAVVAQVYVPANATTLGATSFMDLRRMMFAGGALRLAGHAVAPSGGASGVSLKTLSAPPGVEATVIAVGSGLLASQVYVKSGDASKFRLDAPSFLSGLAGALVSSPSTFSPFLASSPILNEVVVDATLAAKLINAVPPMPTMVGQPLLTGILGYQGASGQTEFAWHMEAQY